jgi:proliferating cell nuclear antigen
VKRGVFKAELDDVGLIQDSMKTISDLISEGLFQLTDDGIKLVAADPAMVALVDFDIEEDVFESFSLDEDTKIGLNLENFYSILRRANSNDTIVFEVKEDDSRFHITLENSSTRNFSLPILNLSEDDIPSTEDLEFEFSADLDASVIESAVKDAMVVGDSVVIEADDSGISISSEGDQSNVDFQIDSNADEVLEIKGGKARSMFSLDYLNSMIGAKRLSNTVSIHLGNDFPMRLAPPVPVHVSPSPLPPPSFHAH